MNEEKVINNKAWQNTNVWKRGLAMLLFGFIAGFVRFIITMISLFQFISLLFTEKPNFPLMKFGQNLNIYLYQINQFLTINSEIYPFPFADWPSTPPEENTDIEDNFDANFDNTHDKS
jgi:hypothetical protein